MFRSSFNDSSLLEVQSPYSVPSSPITKGASSFAARLKSKTSSLPAVTKMGEFPLLQINIASLQIKSKSDSLLAFLPELPQTECFDFKLSLATLQVVPSRLREAYRPLSVKVSRAVF